MIFQMKLDSIARWIEAVPDAMLVIDRAGTIVLANTQTGTLFGYGSKELAGRPVGTLVPEGLHPERAGPGAGSRDEPRLALSGLRADGSSFPVEISLSVVETGEGPLTVASLRDVSKREPAGDRLDRLKSEERFHLMVEAAPSAMAVVDREGRIIQANARAQALFGYSMDELLEQPVEMLVPERFRSGHEKFRRAFSSRPSGRPMGAGRDLFGRRKDGSEVPIEIGLTPYESPAGTFTLALIIDITERKQAEDELRKLKGELEQRVRLRTAQLEAVNKELESFSYSVSHDLRAPLRAIDGFSLALLEDYGQLLPEDGRSYLERVRKAAQRMAVLIDDLLGLSLVTRMPMKTVPIDLSKLARGVVAELRSTQPERRVRCNIASNLRSQGDAHLIRVVLQNLLGNAWKYTSKRKQAEIEFGANRENRETVYFIRDNGAGFDMAYADKLFGAFQRLHAVTDFPGTGIGLATVQRIIRRHGGRIWADAQVDLGATFYFTLPSPEYIGGEAREKESIASRVKELV